MKKQLSFLLASMAILPLLFGCGPSNNVRHVNFTASVTNATLGEYDLHGEFDFDINNFAKKDPSEFDINIAKLAFLSACENSKIDGEKDPNTTILPSLSQLGFTSLERVELFSKDYEEDLNDLTMFEMGTYPFSYSSEGYQLFLIRFRGTTTLADNLSNFDIGVNNENYMIKDNIHKEWKNKNNHKGYDVTANRSVVKFDDYVSKNLKNNAKPIYLITGHSRGAAIANAVAKVYTDRKVKTFGYAFASPTMTDDKSSKNYTNIFNFINKDDLVPYLPPEEIGLTTYGIRKEVSISTNLDIWNKVFPTLPFKHVNIEPIKKLLLDVFTNREVAYQVPISDEKATLLEYETIIDAELAHLNHRNIFDKDTLAYKHTYVGDVTKTDNGYGFIIKSAPIFAFDVVNAFLEEPIRVIASISEILDFLKPMLGTILEVLPEVLSEELPVQFLTAHAIENYYPVIEYFNK